jgi:chromosome partitioning protein
MRVLSIQSQKGGAGKTTLAINLAVAAERARQATVILDLDPQASAAGWRDTRSADAPAVVSIAPGRLAQGLRGAEEGGAGLVIIDTPPHAEASAVAAARSADLVLIPCRPAAFDLRAIGATADAARVAGKPAFALLNAVPPAGRRLVDEARAAISTHGLDTAPVAIGQRAAFVHAATVGLAAVEFEPDGRAAAEIASLWDWLSRQIGIVKQKRAG